MPDFDRTELIPPPAEPARLGKYELRSTVGSGASGTVYDAWDPDLERHVAIKRVVLVGRTEAEQQELKARFRKEAQLAGRLSHPGVVGIYDYGEQDGSAFLVMEFVQGETLARLLRSMRDRREVMAPSRAVAIVQEMLLALEACHRAGVLHRDIKPGNVILASDGSVKLTDFGIARGETSDLTAQGTLLGTPSYMSPEQFEAGGKLDARSDLYACGVVLYELLTGRKPFDGDVYAVMHQVRTDTPPAPSTVVSRIPPALDAVVLRAMAKRPSDRYPDAASFAAGLSTALSTRPRPVRIGPRMLAISLSGAVILALLAWQFQGRFSGPESEAGRFAELQTAGPSPDAPERPGGRNQQSPAEVEPLTAPSVSAASPRSSPAQSGGQPEPGAGAARSSPPDPHASSTAASPTSPPDLGHDETRGQAAASGGGAVLATREGAPSTSEPSDAPVPAAEPGKPAAVAEARAAQAQPSPAASRGDATAALPTAAEPAGGRIPSSQPQTGQLPANLAFTLARLPCAAIFPVLSADGSKLTLRGLVGSETAGGELARLLPQQDGRISAAGLRVFPSNPSACLVAGLVREVPATAIRLDVADSRGRLLAGERITAALHMPDFAGEVLLDYLTDSGRTVVHLRPTGRAERRFDAGAVVKLGPNGDGLIGTVGEPYGIDLVIVTVSGQPLAVRNGPSTEPAEPYLHALAAAVMDGLRKGQRMAVDATVLETAAR